MVSRWSIQITSAHVEMLIFGLAVAYLTYCLFLYFKNILKLKLIF